MTLQPRSEKPATQSERWIAVTLLAVYVLLRMGADPFFWRNLSEYYSYGFELVFVTVSYFLFRKRITFWSKPSVQTAITTILVAITGFGVYRFGFGWLDLPVPFDLSSSETLILLLLFGPVLEEAIFRMALWQSLQVLFGNVWITLLTTTVLFAAGHFAAYPFVPDQFKGFVIYQTLYVLILGLVAGFQRIRSNSISTPIWIHIGFNFGFFLGHL